MRHRQWAKAAGERLLPATYGYRASRRLYPFAPTAPHHPHRCLRTPAAQSQQVFYQKGREEDTPLPTGNVTEANIFPVQIDRCARHVEALRPTRVGEVSAKQVTGFFLKYAREQRLTDWQFRQFVDVAQLLLIDLAQEPGSSAASEDV